MIHDTYSRRSDNFRSASTPLLSRGSPSDEVADVPGLLLREQRTVDDLPVVAIGAAGDCDPSGQIRSGDIVVAVDGHSVEGQPLSFVRRLLQGRPGTSVALIVRRPGQTGIIHANVPRGYSNTNSSNNNNALNGSFGSSSRTVISGAPISRIYPSDYNNNNLALTTSTSRISAPASPVPFAIAKSQSSAQPLRSTVTHLSPNHIPLAATYTAPRASAASSSGGDEYKRMMTELSHTRAHIRALEDGLENERRARDQAEAQTTAIISSTHPTISYRTAPSSEGIIAALRNQVQDLAEQLHQERSNLTSQRDAILDQLKLERADRESLTQLLQHERGQRDNLSQQLSQATILNPQLSQMLEDERRAHDTARDQLQAERDRRESLETQLAEEREIRRKLTEDLDAEVRDRMLTLEDQDRATRSELERLREQVRHSEDVSRRDRLAKEESDAHVTSLTERLRSAEERLAEAIQQARGGHAADLQRARLLEENEVLRRDLSHRELQLARLSAETRDLHDKFRHDRYAIHTDLEHSLRAQEVAAQERRRLEIELSRAQEELRLTRDRAIQPVPPPPPPRSPPKPVMQPILPTPPASSDIAERMRYIQQLREANEQRERLLGISTVAAQHGPPKPANVPLSVAPVTVRAPTAAPVVSSGGAIGGVGIVFDDDTTGQGLPVRTLVGGSPAAMCGLIQEGDKLVMVEDTAVAHMRNEEVKELVRGPLNSAVRLQFRALQPRSFGQDHFSVSLVRSQMFRSGNSRIPSALDGSVNSLATAGFSM